jgi:hypothetical protein
MRNFLPPFGLLFLQCDVDVARLEIEINFRLDLQVKIVYSKTGS